MPRPRPRLPPVTRATGDVVMAVPPASREALVIVDRNGSKHRSPARSMVMRTPPALALAACLIGAAFAAAPPAPPPADAAWGDPLPDGAVARLGTSRFRLGAEHHQSVALSPDGKLIAAHLHRSGKNSRACLIDAAT